MLGRDLLVLLSVHEENSLGGCPLFTMGTFCSVAIAMLATKRTTAPTSPVNVRGLTWVIGCVTQWASVSGRAGRPRIQPRLHPLPMEQRQSQPVPTPVIDHVTTQIFIARDLLGAVG